MSKDFSKIFKNGKENWANKFEVIPKQIVEEFIDELYDLMNQVKQKSENENDECYLETECPRGQMGFYIVGNGNAEPLRARAKSSCFCNLSVTAALCEGFLLADIPAAVGSLDIVMGEIDR